MSDYWPLLRFKDADLACVVSESSEEEDSSEEAAKFRSPRTKGLSNRPKGPQNSQLAVGYKGDLSFVVRGDMIGIFQSQGTGAKKLK